MNEILSRKEEAGKGTCIVWSREDGTQITQVRCCMASILSGKERYISLLLLISKRFGVERKGGLGRLGAWSSWRVFRTVVESELLQQTRLLGGKRKETFILGRGNKADSISLGDTKVVFLSDIKIIFYLPLAIIALCFHTQIWKQGEMDSPTHVLLLCPVSQGPRTLLSSKFLTTLTILLHRLVPNASNLPHVSQFWGQIHCNHIIVHTLCTFHGHMIDKL